MKNRHGFSLIEALLAIGVLAIVVSIALPVFNSVNEKAKQTVCAGNLKLLWSAQRSYQNDHADSFIPYYDGNTWTWTAALMSKGYLGQPTKAFFCPSFPKTTDLTTPESVAMRAGGEGGVGRRGTYSHYGYNYYHLGSSIRYGGNTALSARGAQVSQPSRTILFLDTIYTPGAATPRGTFLATDRQDTSHVPHARHRGHFQIVFVDGHVEAFRPEDPEQIYAPYPAGVGRTTQDGSLWKR